MKKFVSVLALLLVIAMTLCACGVPGQGKLEQLAGDWHCVQNNEQSEAQTLLESLEAYEEELALADLSSLQFVLVYQFDTAKNYSLSFDTEGTTAMIRAFLDGYFHDMYEGRETLSEAYGIDFAEYTEEEMLRFYTELYGYESYDAMLDRLAANACTGEAFNQPLESGTYRISGNKIYMSPVGTTQDEEYVMYSIENNVLTLTYGDMVLQCSKAN